MMMKLMNIVRKDVRVLLSDKKMLAILILMPIILMTILGSGLSGSFQSGTDFEQFNIGIVREYDDVSPQEALESISLIEGIDTQDIELDIDEVIFDEVLKSEDIEKLFVSSEYLSRDSALEALENGEISSVVIFPENFLKDTYINLITPFKQKVEIEIIVDPNQNIKSQIVIAVFSGFENYLNHMITAKSLFTETVIKSGLGYEALENLNKVYESFEGEFGSDINISYSNFEAKKMVNSMEYYSIAMLSMFILFTGGQGGRMMLEEKNQYTYQRMSVSGISKWQMFFGKFITVLIIGIVQISIMIAYTTIALKVSWGSLVNVALITICALLAVAAMGAMISAITLKMGNFKVANMMENFIFQIMAFLGGSFVPVEMLPKVFSNISYFTINGFTLKAYLLNMQGYSILEYRGLLGILLGITVLFISIGIAIMNQEKRWRNVEHHTPADA